MKRRDDKVELEELGHAMAIICTDHRFSEWIFNVTYKNAVMNLVRKIYRLGYSKGNARRG